MDIPVQQRSGQRHFWRRIAIAVFVALFSGLVGEGYATIFYPGDEYDAYLGFRIGASIGLISTLIEVFYIRSQRRSWIRKVAFVPGLIVRILVLTLIVRVCMVGNFVLTDLLLGSDMALELKLSDQIRDTVLSMAIVIVLVILSQLTSVIGLKRFGNLVVGRYFKPVAENRVFVFIDLVGSSATAKRLGDIRFHEYLSELFYQIDQSIVSAGGEIVSYVGDAVIVTWPLTEDRKFNARCVRALRTMLGRLNNIAPGFDREFGERPVFRAAVHGGSVVVGECGDSRRQVTFLGDVVNMTSRIEMTAKTENEQFLISKFMIDQMILPAGIGYEPVGDRVFKGAEDPIFLYRLKFAGVN